MPTPNPGASSPGDDWFSDEQTLETAPRRWLSRAERPAGSGSRRHPPRQALALAKLLAAVVAFIALAVGLGVRLASGQSAADADRGYLSELAVPATDSEATGAALTQLLARKSLTATVLNAQLAMLVARQERDTATAAALQPAPRMRELQLPLLDALRFRDNGLSSLLAAIRDAEATPKRTGWPDLLATQGDRLLTSDVIWQDLFRAPGQAQLAHDGARNATVPRSIFLTSPDEVSPAAMSGLLSKLTRRGAVTATSSSGLLRPGASGRVVSAWQRELNGWLSRQTGLQPLKVDGNFGPSTAAATKALQTAAGITADGVVGPVTRGALHKLLAG